MIFDTQTNFNIGLDIGETSIKLVELYKKGSVLQLSTYAHMYTGVYGGKESGQIVKLTEDKLRLAIRDIYKASGAKSKNFTIGLPMSVCQLFYINLPENAEKILDKIVPIEAKKYVNFPFSELFISYEKLPSHPHQKQGTIGVLVLVAKQSVIDMIHRATNYIVEDQDINIEPNIFGTIRAIPVDKNKPTIIVDLGATLTTVAFIYDGMLMGVESSIKGVNGITERIKSSLGISFTEAEMIKKKYGLLDSEEYPMLKDISTFALRRIVEEVIHIRTRFETRYTTSCSEVWITGGGALTKGILEFMQQEMDVQVKISQSFERIEVPVLISDKLKELSPDFTHAIGLAISKLKD